MLSFLLLTRFQVPDSLALSDAASIPDNIITGFITAFVTLSLPLPSSFPASSPPPDSDAPIIVYGASASSGQYILQALVLAGYKKVIATASPHNHKFLLSLGASAVYDYRAPDFVEQVLAATGGKKVKLAIDTIATKPSLALLSKLVGGGTGAESKAQLAVLLPVKDGNKITNAADVEIHLGIPTWAKDLFPDTDVLPVVSIDYAKVKSHLTLRESPHSTDRFAE